MDKTADGYYLMFETGWFMDLMIPTTVRVKDGRIYFVGSKPCENKDLRPCCMPCGGAEEIKVLTPEDPSVKGFGMIDSFVPLGKSLHIETDVEKLLDSDDIKKRYFNTKGKKERRATLKRLKNDFQILSEI